MSLLLRIASRLFALIVVLAIAVTIVSENEGDGLHYLPLIILALPWTVPIAFLRPGDTLFAVLLAIAALGNSCLLFWTSRRHAAGKTAG